MGGGRLQPCQDVLNQIGVVVLPVHGRAAAHDLGVCPVAAVERARLAQQPEGLAHAAEGEGRGVAQRLTKPQGSGCVSSEWITRLGCLTHAASR